MTQAEPDRMSADEFLVWAMDQPEGRRYELTAGEVVAVSPERAAHARAKLRASLALDTAIVRKGLNCEVFPDGMAVRIDDATVYEPDVLLRRGPPLPGEAIQVVDPVVVVEVLSPSTRARDSGAKLADFFRLSSVRHYLIVKIDTFTVIHHARDEYGAIATKIVSDGLLHLDPPGIEIAVGDMFAQPT